MNDHSHATEEPAVHAEERAYEPLYGKPPDDLELTVEVPAALFTRIVRYPPEQWAKASRNERTQLLGHMIATELYDKLRITERRVSQ